MRTGTVDLTLGTDEQDGAELQAAIISRLPAKIDIGPVYNVDPKRRTAYTSGAFAPPLSVT